MPHVGETFSRPYVFTRAGIVAFAARCEDDNPLHRDEQFATPSRFGGVIASGPHANAVHMAMVATHFTRTHGMVGLEFTAGFVKPIRAETKPSCPGRSWPLSIVRSSKVTW